MRIDTQFSIGDMVFLTTDPEQKRRVVLAITIAGFGLAYSLACGTEVSDHYEFEISNKKDVLQTI